MIDGVTGEYDADERGDPADVILTGALPLGGLPSVSDRSVARLNRKRFIDTPDDADDTDDAEDDDSDDDDDDNDDDDNKDDADDTDDDRIDDCGVVEHIDVISSSWPCCTLLSSGGMSMSLNRTT